MVASESTLFLGLAIFSLAWLNLGQLGGERMSPPPRLGHDTDKVLAETLGLKPEAIAGLRKAGVIG